MLHAKTEEISALQAFYEAGLEAQPPGLRTLWLRAQLRKLESLTLDHEDNLDGAVPDAAALIKVIPWNALEAQALAILRRVLLDIMRDERLRLVLSNRKASSDGNGGTFTFSSPHLARVENLAAAGINLCHVGGVYPPPGFQRRRRSLHTGSGPDQSAIKNWLKHLITLWEDAAKLALRPQTFLYP